jgi:dipeptidyl-peptidase-4
MTAGRLFRGRIALGSILVSSAISLLFAAQGSGQSFNALTVDRIFDAREFADQSYDVQWSNSGAQYVTQVPAPDADGGKDIILVDALSGQQTVVARARDLTPPGKRPLDVAEYAISEDRSKMLIFTNTRRVWRYNTRGDYWILDLQTKRLSQVGASQQEASLMFAKLAPDGNSVAYVVDGDIWLESTVDGQAPAKKLTDKAHPDIINGTSDWVYEEELDVRDGFRWSPDGRYILFWQFDSSGVEEFTLINNTAALYPQLTKFKYPKAGRQNSSVRAGVVDVESGGTRWIELPGDPRDHYLARMEYVPGTQMFLVQQLNRQQNTNTVYEVDSATGSFRTVMVDRDDAWVDVNDNPVWLAGNKSFSWISEKDGWRHLYVVERATGQMKIVTPGAFDVIELLNILPDRNICYFIASPKQATQRYLYRAALDGQTVERVTPENQPGWHSYNLSANGEAAIHNWSQADVPPTIEVVRLPNHETVRTVVTNRVLKSKLAQLSPNRTRFFQVKLDDGTLIDGTLILPPNFDVARKYPVIFYVYGEPWGTTATDHWEGDRYLWHRMMAEKGYVIASLDNRGTKVPKGRGWRKAIYKQIGILASADQAAAAQKLMKAYRWIDEQRVGIWGWSGGGSMTLNAMFRYPQIYKTGISVAPVPDQQYYDTIYQERYMSTPQQNPDGFKNGSPINFAKNLEGNLLIIHGTGDDNCHYQTTELLIDELIRQNKQFSMMAYPNRSHSIREGENTTRHLRTLMTNYFLNNLPPGPR